jgi:hypothetical protein
VQFALTELWNGRDRVKKRITRAGLDAIGGIAGSLDRHATTVVRELGQAHPEAGARVREIALALTTPQGTRATVAVKEIEAGDRERRRALRTLEEARLVVTSADGVTLAHDALLVEWTQLRAWLAEVKVDRLLADEIEREAAEWSADREGATLWSGRRLAGAVELSERATQPLSEAARAFIHAGSVAARRTRALGVGAATLIAVLALLSGLVYVRKLRADQAAAQQVAELERGKASLEIARREELEKAQTELEGRQRKIDELVAQLASAKDPAAIEDVKRRMAEEQEKAHAAQQRVAAATRPKPPTTQAPATPPPPAPRGPIIQREDD